MAKFCPSGFHKRKRGKGPGCVRNASKSKSGSGTGGTSGGGSARQWQRLYAHTANLYQQCRARQR
jgi:hypothetical protein